MNIHASGPEGPETLHLPNVWRIRLVGPGAAPLTPPRLLNALLDVGLITEVEAWKKAAYYQLENPTERYIQFADDTGHTFRHGIEKEKSLDGISKGMIRIENPKIEDHRVTLSFVPPAARMSWVEDTLHTAGINASGLTKSSYRADQWHFNTNLPIDRIPHYLLVTGRRMEFDILVQVAGRLIECKECGSIDHRTNNCPDIKAQKKREYLARQQKRKERDEEEKRERRAEEDRQKAKELDEAIRQTELENEKERKERKEKERNEKIEREKKEKEEKEKQEEERQKIEKENQHVKQKVKNQEKNDKEKQSKTKDQQIDQLHQQIIDQCTISEVPESSRATRKRDRERGSPEKSETKKPHKEGAEEEMTEEGDGKGQVVVGEECPNKDRVEDLVSKQMEENLKDDNPLFGTESTPRSGYGADQSQDLSDPTQIPMSMPSPPTILQQQNAQNTDLPDDGDISEPLSDADSVDDFFKGQTTPHRDMRTRLKINFAPSPENSEEDR